MSWFQNESLDNYKPEPRESRGNRVFDFSLKYGETAKIVFLTNGSDVTNIRLHRVWGLRDMVLRVPCLVPAGKSCPICEVQKRSQNKRLKADPTYFFSVIDTRPYKRDDGTEVPLTKKVYPASSFVLDKIILPKHKLLKEEYETDFRGCLFRASRSEESKGMKPPGTGDILDFIRQVDLNSDEFKEMNQPFSHDELLSMLITDEAEIAKIAEELELAPAAERSVAWDKVK